MTPVRVLRLKSGEKVIQRPVHDVGRGRLAVSYSRQIWPARPDPEHSGGLLIDISGPPLVHDPRPPKAPPKRVTTDGDRLLASILALELPDDGFVDQLLEAHNSDDFVDRLLAAHDVDGFVEQLLRE